MGRLRISAWRLHSATISPRWLVAVWLNSTMPASGRDLLSRTLSTAVLSTRESKSRPDAGIVEFGHVAINQRGETVAQCTRQALMRKKPKATSNA